MNLAAIPDFFSNLEAAPADPIIGLSDAFKTDPRLVKVNLTVGNYLTEEGVLPIQDTVLTASERLIRRREKHGYLPITGLKSFNKALEELVFSEDSPALAAGRVATVQTLGGTGALYLGGLFAKQTLGIKTAVVSNPSWNNHVPLFRTAGLETVLYRYWDPASISIPFEQMLEDIRTLPKRSLVLVHVCCHNPTGLDLLRTQWDALLDILIEGGHLPFLDMAYQGFAEGLTQDAEPVHRFVNAGIPFMVSTSMSKGFSIYGERTGTLHVVARDAKEAQTVQSLLRRHVRATYSNPPLHGAMLVNEILNDPELRVAWRREVEDMRLRIVEMRRLMEEAGRAFDADLSFITRQRGIFSLTGFTSNEMKTLREEFGVYGIDNGRIAVAGLTKKTVPITAEAFAKVLARRP